MYITLLSFGLWWRLFEGGYYYAHLSAACGGYTSAATISGAARIRENIVTYMLPINVHAECLK